MRKRILVLAMTVVTTDSLTACSGSSETDTKVVPTETGAPASEGKSEAKEESRAGEGDAANTFSSKGGTGGYESVLITDLGTINDESFNQSAREGFKKYAEGNSISYKYYRPQEGTTDSYLETIGLVIKGGAKLVICPRFLFEEPIYPVQDKYPDMHFILLDGEPHNVDYDYKTNNNAMPILFQEDQASFLVDYAIAKDGYTKFGFMGGMAVPVVIHFGYGFVQGAEFVAEEDRITGLEVIYNYTGASSTTPGAQSMAASWYQNDAEVIFRCGEVVGNSIMATTQGKNVEVTGVGVDRSAEFETVITSAVKFLPNSVYGGVEDSCDGGFPEGKTPVFIAASNGMGLPMDASKFEKLSQEQYDTICRKLTDGEIGLVQFSTNSNDPTKDLTDLTSTKVIFVERGLAAIRAVQGSEMTCNRQS